MFYPQGDPLGHDWFLEIKNMLNLHNFSTTSPTLNSMMSLDKAGLNLKLSQEEIAFLWKVWITLLQERGLISLDYFTTLPQSMFAVFGENMCYQIQIPFIFVIFFSDIGQCFWPTQTKSLVYQKSGYVMIILDKI